MQVKMAHPFLAARQKRSTRPDNFFSGDPIEYLIWRRNTMRLFERNGWNNARNSAKAKIMILISLAGRAALITADIRPIDSETVEALLDRLQERFLPTPVLYRDLLPVPAEYGGECSH